MRNRPPRNSIREEEKTAIRVDSFSYPDRGGDDARYLRRHSGIRSESHHVEAVPGIDYSLSILVFLLEDLAVSRPH